MESKEKQAKDQELIIPFIHRKSILLSISFRSLDFEMSEFKMKVTSLNEDDFKEPLITGLCETTMVILLIKIYIFLNLYIGSKIPNRFQK